MTDNTITDVRQLCLRLKPILGSKIDQIYESYIKDTEGRNQIQHYVELLAAKYLPQKLEQSDIMLLPPSKEQAAGEYEIGMVTYAGKQLYPFGLREDEWIQHCAILGRSGAGKTNCAFQVLSLLKKKGKPFLVLDWKRSYRDLISLPQFSDVEIYTVGRNVVPFTFNPLIPPEGTDPKTWLKKLISVICHAYCLGNGCAFLLQQAVSDTYEDAGVYDGTVNKYPTFQDVMVKARNMDSRGREVGWLSSTLRALSSLCFGDMDRMLNANNNKSLNHILDKSVVLELDALTQSDKVFFASSMLLWIHHKRMTETSRETLKRVTLIEESHHLLSDERKNLAGGQSVMEIVFREIREFGEALILLDQHPSKISLPALGNCYTTICLNLKHKTDINAMAQCMLLDKDRDILGSLEVGHAVVKLQGRIQRPFQISIPLFKIEKGKVTDEQVCEHMKYSAPSIRDEDFIIDATQPYKNIEVDTSEAIQITNFLKDIEEYPDSGIAARYKRLGLSVRQGQKLKNRLIDQGLIEEHLDTTNKGRLSIIQLTPKGKAMLAAA